MDINELLKKAHVLEASDLHIKVGSPPILRIYGELTPLSSERKLSHEDALNIALPVMTPGQTDIFNKKNDIDLAYSVSRSWKVSLQHLYAKGNGRDCIQGYSHKNTHNRRAVAP